MRTNRREQRRERKEQEQAAALAAQRSARKRKFLLVIVPFVIVALAIGLFQIGFSHFLVGMVLLAGFFCWLAIGLGAIGGSVQPRNRRNAGSIDYGKRG
ncbi:MAG: hypothetical protein JXA30_13245 [Deltaproteobacteria bacterium]|nr:hypothetical protein [Deltaproteobacteria bacterium]